MQRLGFFRDDSAILFIADCYEETLNDLSPPSCVVTSTGCSAGQELWFIAMALSDVRRSVKSLKVDYEMVDVDASIKSFETAIKATYSLQSRQEIPSKYHQYLNKQGGFWHLVGTVKARV